jgi:hypothetical protein
LSLFSWLNLDRNMEESSSNYGDHWSAQAILPRYVRWPSATQFWGACASAGLSEKWFIWRPHNSENLCFLQSESIVTIQKTWLFGLIRITDDQGIPDNNLDRPSKDIVNVCPFHFLRS